MSCKPAETITDKTGTGGMPQFVGLTDEGVQALAAFLTFVTPSAAAKQGRWLRAGGH